VRAGLDTLPAEDAPLIIEPEFPFLIEAEDLAGTDADAGTAVHAFALVIAHSVIKDMHVCSEGGHRIADKPALLVRDIDQGFPFG
jgi:hypothetical protein